LNDNYAKDKNNVYYWWDKLEWADVDTFEVLIYNYGKDKNNVYYEWKKIEWVLEPDKFKIIDDKYWEYNWEKYFLWKKEIKLEIIEVWDDK